MTALSASFDNLALSKDVSHFDLFLAAPRMRPVGCAAPLARLFMPRGQRRRPPSSQKSHQGDDEHHQRASWRGCLVTAGSTAGNVWSALAIHLSPTSTSSLARPPAMARRALKARSIGFQFQNENSPPLAAGPDHIWSCSANEWVRVPATIIWSSARMSTKASTVFNVRVRRWSASDGAGSPLG